MSQITDLLYDFELACFAVANEQSGPTEKAEWQSTKAALLASLSHTMGVKGLECHCTKIEQDETCPVGYPSLLCEDCDGKGIRSALTPTQQPEPEAYVVEGPGWKRVFLSKEAAEILAKPENSAVTPLYALASPQAVSGWEKALEHDDSNDWYSQTQLEEIARNEVKP